MSLDLATVGISVDTSGVVRGEQQAVKSFGNIANAADKVATATTKTLPPIQQSAAALAGLGTAADKMAGALRAAGYAEEQITKEITRTTAAINQATEADKLRGVVARAETRAYQEQAARNSAAAEKAASTAAAGSKKFENALQSLSIAASGVPGPLGRVVGVAGQLAIGSGLTVAVLGGVAALGLAIEALGERSRKARERIDEVITKLKELRKAEGDTAYSRFQVVRAEVVAKEKEVAELKTRLSQFSGSLASSNPNATALQRAQRELTELRDLQAVALRDVAAFQKEVGDKAVASAKRQSETAKTAFEERRAQVKQIAEAEFRAATARGELSGRISDIESVIHAKAMAALKEQIAASDRLGKSQKERLEAEGKAAIKAEAVARYASRAFADFDPRLSITDQSTKDAVTRGSTLGARLSPVAISQVVDDAHRTANAIEEAYEESARRIERTFEQMFRGIFSGSKNLFEGLGDAVTDSLARKAAQAASKVVEAMKPQLDIFSGGVAAGRGGISPLAFSLGAGVNVSKGLGGLAGAGAGVGLGLQSGNAASGLLTGAGAGFALGGPLGAVAGGVSGIVGGLLGSAEKAREAARLMRKAQEEFDKSLQAYVDAATGRTTELSRALAANQETVAGLTNSAKGLAGQQITAAVKVGDAEGATRAIEQFNRRMAELTAASEAAAAQLTKEAEEKLRRNQEDLENRAITARLSGRTGPDAIAAQRSFDDQLRGQKQLREVLDAVNAKWSDAELRLLRAAQQEENLSVIRQRAAEDAQKAFDNAQTLGGIQARILELSANATDQSAAAILRRKIAIDGEIHAAMDLVAQGTITTQLFNDLSKALYDNAAAADAATVAAKAARDAEIANTLRLRGLSADARISGSPADQQRFEDERRRAEQEAEIARAVADGWSEAQQAQLRVIQSNEDFAASIEKTRAAMQSAAEAARAEAQAMQDLNTRHLRATGQGGAAEVADQYYRQQQEIEKAIADGRSTDYIANVRKVQAEERLAADEARRQQQQSAYDSAFGSGSMTESIVPESRTSVNLAVGTSESTSQALMGVMRSQLSYQASLPRIEQVLIRSEAVQRTLVNLLQQGRANGGLTVDEIDQGLAVIGATADQIAGNPPSIR